LNPTAVIENNNINVCISISNPLSKRVIAFKKKYGPIQDYCYCYSRVIGLISLLALYKGASTPYIFPWQNFFGRYIFVWK